MNEEVKTIFILNAFTLNKNLEGITQEESLICPDKGGSNLNWVVGHIVVSRDALNEIVRLEKMCSEKLTSMYIRRSNVPGNKDAADTNELLQLYNKSQAKILKVLGEKDFKDEPEASKEIAAFGFHEAYHAGQTGVLRRIAGKPGAIK